VVTKLDRLARSVADAHEIAKELTAWEVKLNLGGSIHDPTDPMGKLLFTAPAMVAELEADLTRLRTREGEGQGAAAGREAQAHPEAGGAPGRAASCWGAHDIGAGRVVRVARSTVYRAIERAAASGTVA
jgi:DNA invertase Pin-like site-specific DNA recombinase